MLASLEAMRKRLLDLSNSNRLINFKDRTNHIRVVGEAPDHIYELLMQGEELRFLSIPSPVTKLDKTEKSEATNKELGDKQKKVNRDKQAIEYAKELGFDTDYELPLEKKERNQKKQDKSIQTLFFADSLEARLRHTHNESQRFIEETGANTLYLIFGFLEWFESKNSNVSHLAPLYLVPVALNKGKLDTSTNTFIYTLDFTEEEILPNLSLREKLKIDFGLNLPDLKQETTPEEYFDEIRKMIKAHHSHWKIHRYCTLSLLHFGKLLLYLDLDPARWPEEKNITAHPLICKLLGNEKKENRACDIFDKEYEIDTIPNIHDQYPLIDDADSSQHSVLIDVLKGKNLVVEGPPGTGKSQTIANIIAAATAQGKKILFVTEKLVALEVVKKRLDKAGLGDFCLELHSHKTQKGKVLQDIAVRLENKYPKPRDIQAEINRYEQLKEELMSFATQINEDWKQTGKSPHQILNTTTRFRKELNHIKMNLNDLHPQSINGETFTFHIQKKIQDILFQYKISCQKILQDVGDTSTLAGHAWNGVSNLELQPYDTDKVWNALENWQKSTQSLLHSMNDAYHFFYETENSERKSLNIVNKLISDIRSLPHIEGNEYLCLIPTLQGERLKILSTYINEYKEINASINRIKNDTNFDQIDNFQIYAIEEAVNFFHDLSEFQPTMLSEIVSILCIIDRISLKIDMFSAIIEDIGKCFGNEFADIINLSKTGIKEFKKFHTLINELDFSLWKKRDPLFDNHELDEILPLLENDLLKIKQRKIEISAIFKLEDIIDHHEVIELHAILSEKNFFGIFNKKWRKAKKRLHQISANKTSKFKLLFNKLNNLLNFFQENVDFETNAVYCRLLGKNYKGLNTEIYDIIALRNWYKKLRRHYTGRKSDFRKTLLSLSNEEIIDIQALLNDEAHDLSQDILKELTEINSICGNKAIIEENSILHGNESILRKWKTKFDYPIQISRKILKTTEITINKASNILSNVLTTLLKIEKWKSNNLDSLMFDGRLQLANEFNNDQLLDYAEKTLYLAKIIENIGCSSLKNSIYKNPTVEHFSNLLKLLDKLQFSFASFESMYIVFKTMVTLNTKKWHEPCGEDIEDLIKRNNKALANKDLLMNWIDYLKSRDQLINYGFFNLIELIENGQLPISKLDDIYCLIINDLLSREIFNHHEKIKTTSSVRLDTTRQLFIACDNKLKFLQCKNIASSIAKNEIPRGLSGRADDYTDLLLLQRECSKKKRHLPIRQLVHRAHKALLAMKPCFMMGPLSVAQYLPAGLIEFDIVIMDEASQIKPEDVLGTIARGKQIVIIGDSKQLPPTNFFAMATDEDEEENATLQDYESILDAAQPLFDKRCLRWHYRSQHESLIAFSNDQFYRNLIIFPSPHKISTEYGIKFYRVENSRFKDRVNNEEALEVAKAIENHLLNNSCETLGVVSMNSDQRDLIIRLIEERGKSNPLFRQLYEEKSNPKNHDYLFIKNLENVQGDERDVIFISCTYGPHEYGGKVHQRFGPINSDSGWRRLNVLFTRSKKRMHVFSSMGPEDIISSNESSRGQRAFRDFLFFAENGVLKSVEHTGRMPDSDFEISVASALYDAGYECEAQVGVAGYFIDLAVKHPEKQGYYLMGIECDGATYHSAKSVRDRDRLRQEILEQKGWKIKRIWSTDWFKNSQAALSPILKELEELK